MRRLLFLSALLIACSSEPATDAPAEAPAVDVTDPSQPVPDKIDFEASVNTGRTAMFVPAPTEFEAVLAANAPGAKLAAALHTGPVTLTGMSKPLLALETGTRINNALVTAQDGDRAGLEKRIGYAKEGLIALQAAPAVLAQVDSFVSDLQSGALSDSELVPALDVLAESIQDGLIEGRNNNTSTLVQAGGWVQGAHLLAKALEGREVTPDAGALFHQSSLVNHFIVFLQLSGPGRSGDPQVLKVIGQMEELREIAGQDPISGEQVARIAALTGEIMLAFRNR